jgi:hypothetical protein
MCFLPMNKTPNPTNASTVEQAEQDLAALRMLSAGQWQLDDASFERIKLPSLRSEERMFETTSSARTAASTLEKQVRIA